MKTMMMMKQKNLLLNLLLMAGLFMFSGCDDDDGPAALNIEAITATGTDLETGNQATMDLNTATAPSNVPTDAVIDITFSRNVDQASVNNSSITISDGTNNITATPSVNGNVVSLTLPDGLERGTDYTLSIGSVRAEDGGALAATTRSFKTGGRQAVTPPQQNNQVAYWKFDGDATDEVGAFDADTEIAIDYQEDRFGTMSSAAYFNGDNSIIEVPNASPLLTDTESVTFSFWVKTNSTGHVNENGDPTGMFVFGLGAFFGIQYEIFSSYEGSKFAISYVNSEGTEVTEDMWFPAGATDNTSGGWQGWDYARNLTPDEMRGIIKDQWYHVVYTYNAPERKGSLYFNGELMKSFDFDLWPEGDAKQTVTGVTYRGNEPDVVDDLAFGFVQSREGTMWDNEPWGGYDIPTSQHFKGWLDDFRIFNTALTAEEVETLHNAERP